MDNLNKLAKQIFTIFYSLNKIAVSIEQNLELLNIGKYSLLFAILKLRNFSYYKKYIF